MYIYIGVIRIKRERVCGIEIFRIKLNEILK